MMSVVVEPMSTNSASPMSFATSEAVACQLAEATSPPSRAACPAPTKLDRPA
jgi:hypothetical protein